MTVAINPLLLLMMKKKASPVKREAMKNLQHFLGLWRVIKVQELLLIVTINY